MEDRSDEALVLATRAGDQAAFARLVHRYRDRHARFAIRMLGSRDHDNGRVATVAGTQLTRTLPAVHHRHHHVEQDDGRHLLRN